MTLKLGSNYNFHFESLFATESKRKCFKLGCDETIQPEHIPNSEKYHVPLNDPKNGVQ